MEQRIGLDACGQAVAIRQLIGQSTGEPSFLIRWEADVAQRQHGIGALEQVWLSLTVDQVNQSIFQGKSFGELVKQRIGAVRVPRTSLAACDAHDLGE